MIKPEPLRMLEKWIQADNEEEFTARVYFTLRDMYTIVRGKSNFTTTQRDHFVDAPRYVGAMPPRFDLFEKAQNASIRANATKSALATRTAKDSMMRGKSQPTVQQMIKSFHFEPLMDPKKTR